MVAVLFRMLWAWPLGRVCAGDGEYICFPNHPASLSSITSANPPSSTTTLSGRASAPARVSSTATASTAVCRQTSGRSTTKKPLRSLITPAIPTLVAEQCTPPKPPSRASPMPAEHPVHVCHAARASTPSVAQSISGRAYSPCRLCSRANTPAGSPS
ncbi:hypothetical protein Dimus_028964 [Dionaea muscipula]